MGGGMPTTGGNPGTGGGQPTTGGAGGAKTCGGLHGIQCGAGEFCAPTPEAKCGGNDAFGVCVTIPTACDDVYDPVCGCDGKTYANECEAAAKSTTARTFGECTPRACDGLSGQSCLDGEFCDHGTSSSCDTLDDSGVCRPIPEACDAIYAPVCGCNGASYLSSCHATLNGLQIAKPSLCDAGTACNDSLNIGCPDDQYCFYPPEANCGWVGALGYCVHPTGGLTDNAQAVCGCDGKTYTNASYAAAARVSLRGLGPCPLGGP